MIKEAATDQLEALLDAAAEKTHPLPPGALLHAVQEVLGIAAAQLHGLGNAELLADIRAAGVQLRAAAEAAPEARLQLEGVARLLDSVSARLRALPQAGEGDEPSPKGGRPRGRATIHPLSTPGDVLELPADGAMGFAAEALAQPPGRWKHDMMGRPEYTAVSRHISGSVVVVPPGDERMTTRARNQAELEATSEMLWAHVTRMGAAELQLLMFLSNAWLTLPQATDGIPVSPASYARARGLDHARSAKRGAAERDSFNGLVERLASLDLHAQIALRVKGKRREIQTIQGRLVLAEAISGVYTGPLEGFDGPRRADVTAWRLVPGAAWLASRQLAQLGRYPRALLQLNPRRDSMLIRLGVYLGYQTAVRASSGTLAQPLSVGAILRGIGEEVPADRRLLGKLKGRLEGALDVLQQKRVLTSWQWEREPSRGQEGLASATIVFIYHEQSLDAHVEHHPAAKRVRKTPAMQRLEPAKETPPGGDKNSRRR